MSKMPMNDSIKLQLQTDFVNNMTKIVEKELDNIGDKYSGFGPNRRRNFKKTLSISLVSEIVPPTPPSSPQSRIPQKTISELNKLGFSETNVDTILSLISLPENSTLSWWNNYNYAERLHDGRGWTVTLYGACSGTGDLVLILEYLQKLNPKHPLIKFIPVMKKTKGDDVKGLEDFGRVVKTLGDDKQWQEAVWRIYIDLYWKFAADFADKTGIAKDRPGAIMKCPLTRGFMVDVALNHGANMESFKPILNRMKNANETNENDWFYDFCEARRDMLKHGVDDLDTSKTGDRCMLWKNILKENNRTLKREIYCYPGYWGDVILK